MSKAGGGVQPQTAGNDLAHLGAVLSIARPAWGYQVDPHAMGDARKVLRKLNNMGNGIAFDAGIVDNLLSGVQLYELSESMALHRATVSGHSVLRMQENESTLSIRRLTRTHRYRSILWLSRCLPEVRQAGGYPLRQMLLILVFRWVVLQGLNRSIS